VRQVEDDPRVRAPLRRVAKRAAVARHVGGDLDIRPDESRVLRAGVEVKLTKTAFRVPCELAASPDKVLRREALRDRVWGDGYFGDERLVDVHTRRRRTKIEADPAHPRLVVTVRGLGDRLGKRVA
jgi:DNA-binding response OmpR family regulator